MARATWLRPITGVWHPTIVDGCSTSTRSTVRWNLASSTRESQGLMYWANIGMPSVQKPSSSSATSRTGALIGAAKASEAQ